MAWEEVPAAAEAEGVEAAIPSLTSVKQARVKTSRSDSVERCIILIIWPMTYKKTEQNEQISLLAQKVISLFVN